MNILLVIDDYLPESTRVGPKMLHELAIELTRQGHDVTVLAPGEWGQGAMCRELVMDGVRVLRFRSPPVKDIHKVLRALSESALSFFAWWALRRKVHEASFDLVVCYSPSIFFGVFIGWLKKKMACKTYLVLRDLFPQWAIDEGMIRERSLIAHYFRFFERKNYQVADSIGLMSIANKTFFDGLWPRLAAKTHVLPNWASADVDVQQEIEVPFRSRLNLQGKVIYLYGGNIGHAQDMANLMRLAEAMQSYSQAHFLFVGQGDEVGLIQDYMREKRLSNCTYLPSIPQPAFKALLQEVDVGLFSLAYGHRTHNFPGKLLGYMANAIPILGSVNPGNDLMPVVNENEAGFVCINGEDQYLFEAAERLLLDADLRLRVGNNACQLLDRHFSVVSAMHRITSCFVQ